MIQTELLNKLEDAGIPLAGKHTLDQHDELVDCVRKAIGAGHDDEQTYDGDGMTMRMTQNPITQFFYYADRMTLEIATEADGSYQIGVVEDEDFGLDDED